MFQNRRVFSMNAVTLPGRIVLRACRSFLDDNCFHLSAAVAFYSIISVIPILYLIFYTSGMILGSSERAYVTIIEFIKQLHPYVEDKLILEIKHLSDASGATGWLALAFLLWISTMFVNSLETAFGTIFDVRHKRHPLRSLIMGGAVIPVGLVAILFSIGVAAATKILAHWQFGYVLINSTMIKYIIPFSVIVVFFTLVFWIIPNTRISGVHAVTGGVICAGLLEVAKYFFNLYLSMGGNPAGFVYGSLKALIYVAVWVFYLAVIILFTGEIVAILEQERNKGSSI